MISSIAKHLQFDHSESKMTSEPDFSDNIVDNSKRATRWFCTVNNPYARNFYTALAIKLGHADDHSAQEILADPFLARLNTHDTVFSYFNSSDAAIVWETAPTTGRYHLHVTIHNRNKLSRRQVMDILGPCDIRIMIAAPHIAHQYLTKTGNQILYVGNPNYWLPPSTTTSSSIDWRSVLSKAQTCTDYVDFMRKFVTGTEYDQDCLRASLTRSSWIQACINCRPSPRKDTSAILKTIWQDSLVSLAKTPPSNSHRKIVNIWSSESGTGKSTLADLIRNEGIKVFVFPSNLKLHDAIYMYADQPVVIVDLARHAAIESSDIYEVLETLSDQRVCSTGKYGGKRVRWMAHIFVLSNTKLDPDRLPGRFDFIEARPFTQEAFAEMAISLDFMSQ